MQRDRDESGKFKGKAEAEKPEAAEREPVEVDPFDAAQRARRTPEPEPEPVEAKSETPEPELEKPAEAAAPVEAPEAEAEAAPEPEPDDTGKPGERAHEKGLRKEIERLRREKREWEERWQSLESLGRLRDAGITPQPQQTQQTPQPQPGALPPRLEVEFDPATGKAYIPADRLSSLVEERLRPDPFAVELQRRAQVEQQLRADFVGQDPRRGELYSRAEQAKRMAEEIAVGAARRRGIDTSKLGGADEIVAFIRDTGALDEVGEKFPDLGAQQLEDMMYAAAVGSPRLLRRALDAYAASALRAAEAAPIEHRPAPEPEMRDLPPEKPRSMAQRGAPDRKGSGSKESRFRELEERFAADQFSLTKAEYAEYGRLLAERERAA